MYGNLSQKWLEAQVSMGQHSVTAFYQSNQTRCHSLISANKPTSTEPSLCSSVWLSSLQKSHRHPGYSDRKYKQTSHPAHLTQRDKTLRKIWKKLSGCTAHHSLSVWEICASWNKIKYNHLTDFYLLVESVLHCRSSAEYRSKHKG